MEISNLSCLGSGHNLYLFLNLEHPLFVLRGGRAHPEDELAPQEPEDVVEEGDGQQEDGEQPPLANDELQHVHSLRTIQKTTFQLTKLYLGRQKYIQFKKQLSKLQSINYT